MKTHVFLLLFLLSASVVFSEPNTTLFGEFVFDYDITEDMTEGDDPALGGFNMPKALIGADTTLSDKVSAHFTYRMRMNALKKAYFDWMVSDGFTVSAGRMEQVFAPESEWYDNAVNKFDGAGIAYDAKKFHAALQTGNTIENPDPKNTGEALYIMPAITYTDNFDEICFTFGVNSQYISAYDDTYSEMDEEDHVHMNAYTVVRAGGFNGLVSTDFNEVQDSDVSNMDLNTKLTYRLERVTPGVMIEMHDIVHEDNDMQMDMEIFAMIAAAPGLIIKPIIGLDNMNEENGQDFTKMFTLKCLWKPKFTF